MLGAVSYSLYLTHTIVLEMLRTLGGVAYYLDFQKSLIGLFVAVAVAVVVAILIHFSVEKPSLSVLRKRLAPVLRPRPAKGD
jgi:peptidoglycan/LPS O-acetylase OafA/YrhL